MITRYDIGPEGGGEINIDVNYEGSGDWIRYDDYIAEKSSMTHDAVLGEGWQDIRIKLPNNEQIVLIAESDKTIKKGYYIEEENQWYYLLDNGYYNTTEDVCFWLYIPDLPSFA